MKGGASSPAPGLLFRASRGTGVQVSVAQMDLTGSVIWPVSTVFPSGLDFCVL